MPEIEKSRIQELQYCDHQMDSFFPHEIPVRVRHCIKMWIIEDSGGLKLNSFQLIIKVLGTIAGFNDLR